MTDAIQKLNQIQRVFAYDFEGKRYDVGEKLGFITTTIEFALQDPTLRDDLLAYLEEVMPKKTVSRMMSWTLVHFNLLDGQGVYVV